MAGCAVHYLFNVFPVFVPGKVLHDDFVNVCVCVCQVFVCSARSAPMWAGTLTKIGLADRMCTLNVQKQAEFQDYLQQSTTYT